MRDKFISSLFIFSFLLASCQSTGSSVNTSNITSTTSASTDESEANSSTKSEDPVSSPTVTITTDIPDLNRETITIYQIADTTSALAGLKTPEINGVADAIAEINQEEGIFGAGLILKHFETGGDPSRAAEAYHAILADNPNPLLILVYDAWTAEIISPLAAKDGILVFSTAASEVAIYGTENSTTFSFGPTYSEQLIWLGNYLNVNWSLIQPDETGIIKLAIFTWVEPYSFGAFNETAQAHLKENGVEIVYIGEMPYSYTADTSNLILEARAMGANVIFMDMSAFGTAQTLNNLQWLAVRENIVFMGSNEGLDISTYGFLLNPIYAAQSYVPFHFTWWNESDHPGIQAALANFEKNNRSPGEKSIGRLIAQASIDTTQHILENAILEVGINKLNSQVLYDQIIVLENYPAMNGVMNITFTADRHSLIDLHLRITGNEFGSYIDAGYAAEVPDWRVP